MIFNKKEYNKNYMREKRKAIKQFRVDLSTEELNELEDLLKQNNYKTKAEFLRDAIKKILKKEK